MNAVATRHQPTRVVVVDDTPDLRELLSLALTRGGMDVVGEAGDGRAGIEVVRTLRPDLVMLDLSMPVMDGLAALPSIRRLIPEGKIIVLSGFGATQMSEQALATGADGYLQKGLSLKRILDYVRSMVEDAAPREHVGGTPPRPSVSPGLSLVPPVGDPAAVTPDASESDAVRLSPYGIVEVAEEPDLRVLSVNPAARRLLSDQVSAGAALADVAPLLASHLAGSAGAADDTILETELGGVETRVTVRRGPRSLLLFLGAGSTSGDVLRRAIATTAHEIRGPVAVLCGVAETLEHEGEMLDEHTRLRLMSSVSKQARALDAITQDLLTASQVHRAPLHLDLATVRPSQIVDSVVEERRVESVTVRVEDVRSVRADPVRLEQMVGNLLGNAVKYGRAPYVVVVRPHRLDPAQVCIDVVDSGAGVPEAFRARLFLEFSRSPGTAAPGTGLGLYVVRSLADAQHGSVSYAPAPAGGAIFTISLPAV